MRLASVLLPNASRLGPATTQIPQRPSNDKSPQMNVHMAIAVLLAPTLATKKRVSLGITKTRQLKGFAKALLLAHTAQERRHDRWSVRQATIASLRHQSLYNVLSGPSELLQVLSSSLAAAHALQVTIAPKLASSSLTASVTLAPTA
jgi:hypothetical protein